MGMEGRGGTEDIGIGPLRGTNENIGQNHFGTKKQ